MSAAAEVRSRADVPDLAAAETYASGVPHAAFAWLREHDPVSWHDDPSGRRGFWLLARYDDVVAASRDPATFSSRAGVTNLDDLDDEQLDARRTMLEEDPPRHGALRSLVRDCFTPRAVRAYESFVALLARAKLQEALACSEREGWVDAVAAIAEPVPIRVLARMLGVADTRTAELLDWGNRLIAGEPTPGGGRLRLVPFGSPVSLEAFVLADEMKRARAGGEPDDVTTRLAYGLVDGAPLSDAEYRAMWLLLVIAGNETTRHAISSGVEALATHPSELARLQAEPSLVDVATEEVLRWSTPINWHRRTASRDVDIGGRKIRAGDKVLLSFTSANRDPARFARPFHFDVERRPNDHVTFGRGGPHFCLGAHLARLEVRAVMGEVVAQVSSAQLAGEPQRLRSNHFNGFVRLPVALGGRAASPSRRGSLGG